MKKTPAFRVYYDSSEKKWSIQFAYPNKVRWWEKQTYNYSSIYTRFNSPEEAEQYIKEELSKPDYYFDKKGNLIPDPSK